MSANDPERNSHAGDRIARHLHTPLILGALPVRMIDEAALRRGLPGYGEYTATRTLQACLGVW